MKKQNKRSRLFARVGLALLGAQLVFGIVTIMMPAHAVAQTDGSAPVLGHAAPGGTAGQVEGTLQGVINWGCNVICPMLGIGSMGVAGVKYTTQGRWGSWAVGSGVMLGIAGLGRFAESMLMRGQTGLR